VPLDRVTSFATRTVKVRHYCLVKIRSSDGAEGLGYCYAGNSAGKLVCTAVQELMALVLIREESTRVEGLWEEMYREALLQGCTGSVMRALSALDIALWDLNARSVDMPLYRYLGCWTLDRVPAYASGGYYLDGKTPQHLAEELRRCRGAYHWLTRLVPRAAAPPSSFGPYSRELAGADGSVSERHNGAR
jgi:L-alanine-DL-glutamate epimerase-like enolase superfamily enzyme